jgi:dTDP-4-amino-4,6-dideoxygalactose transaminase
MRIYDIELLNMAHIPLYKPQDTFSERELNAIRDVLKSGWLTLGPKTAAFESAFAEYVRVKYGVATSSCTSALYLALNALGIGKGDSVVVPVNTFVATANVVRWVGAEPAFCDVGLDGEMDPERLAEILENDEHIKCVIPVHVYGYPCDMDAITQLASRHHVKIVEDCAQSHGAAFRGKRVGSFGDSGCFSFYATKNITTGEGGMLVTDNEKVQKKALLRRNHGQTKSPSEKAVDWHYDIEDLGFNFRMSEIEAAMGLVQLEKINDIIKRRRDIAKKYWEALKNVEGIKMLHDPDDKVRQGVFHLLEIAVEKPYPLTRDELYHFFAEKGIITGVHYMPLHFFSYYKKTTKYRKGDFPCAEALCSRILSLPMFTSMTEKEIQTIIEVLKAKPFK